MTRKTKILTVFAGLLLGGIGFVLFFAFSDAVPADRFAQVSKGVRDD
jgi:hypothetical protein